MVSDFFLVVLPVTFTLILYIISEGSFFWLMPNPALFSAVLIIYSRFLFIPSPHCLNLDESESISRSVLSDSLRPHGL